LAIGGHNKPRFSPDPGVNNHFVHVSIPLERAVLAAPSVSTLAKSLALVFFIFRPIANEQAQLTLALKSQYMRSDPIQKPAIMAHYNGAPSEILQSIL
jgi:hypothetical protein